MFSSKSGAAKLSLIVVIGLIVLKIAVAIITGSISLLAQAMDSLLDLFAVLLTFFAIRTATKPADEEHPFGHGKVEDFSAVVQAVLIFTAGGVVIYSAIQRIIVGEKLEFTEAGIGVMVVSIIASIFLSRHLHKVARATDSIVLEANARNIAADVYSALGVLAGLVIIRFTELSILDPIIALGVALLILKTGYDVARRSMGGLIDTRLPQEEEDIIADCITEHTSELAGFHEVRTRKSGSWRYIDLHLVMPSDASVEEAHRMCDHLEQDIKNQLPNTNIVIHVEPCNQECQQCPASCKDKPDKA